MNTAKRRAWAKANGICSDCSRPSEPNRLRCKNCLKNDAKGTIKYRKARPWYIAMAGVRARERRRVAGKCIRCGLKLGEQDAPNFKCQNCREELCI